MKKLFFGLLALTSLSSFANETYTCIFAKADKDESIFLRSIVPDSGFSHVFDAIENDVVKYSVKIDTQMGTLLDGTEEEIGRRIMIAKNDSIIATAVYLGKPNLLVLGATPGSFTFSCNLDE